MKFEPKLLQGILIKRYKRFLADIETNTGELITIHCPNTGSMRNCVAPGQPCWYSTSDSKTRKYPHTWELATTPDGCLAGINTHRANELVAEAVAEGRIAALDGYAQLHREVKYGDENSRIDLLLSDETRANCYVEIKSVTLHEGAGLGLFPDAVSSRGAKHLRELMAMAAQGQRAVLFFCVQHSAIERVAPADEIDPLYGKLLREAAASGVEVMAWRAQMSAQQFSLVEPLAVEL